MNSWAVVVERPETLALDVLELDTPGANDVVVDIDYSGISTGTERLLYNGAMPYFPGLGYPLVPGYESVGRVRRAGENCGLEPGRTVFVPGAQCFGSIRGLFGGAAQRLVVSEARVTPIDSHLGERSILLALAATAYHALNPWADGRPALPDLIVGHGVLGRLIARLCLVLGDTRPTVWERDPIRRESDVGYTVCDPAEDTRRDYRRIIDVSGDADQLDTLIGTLARGGEIVLAGFYSQRLSFDFPPAFMREARLRVAAEWQRSDLDAVNALATSGQLSLDGLITHRHDASDAARAYERAFNDASCLKTILDWRALS